MSGVALGFLQCFFGLGSALRAGCLPKPCCVLRAGPCQKYGPDGAGKSGNPGSSFFSLWLSVVFCFSVFLSLSKLLSFVFFFLSLSLSLSLSFPLKSGF